MKKLFFLFIPVFLLTGCATVMLDTRPLDKPVSMTSKVDDMEYTVVKHFKRDVSSYWLLGLFPISQPDLSKVFIEEIDGHDGTVNVRFRETWTVKDLIIYLVSMGVVEPASYTVEGDVIKFKK